MTELLNRDFTLNAGGLEIRSKTPQGKIRPTLKVTFRVELTLSRDLNSAEVSIYNLSKTSRGFLSAGGLGAGASVPTSISAGYVDNISQIFLGDLEYGRSFRNGADWITTLQSQDGAVASTSRISESFKKIKIGEVLRQLTERLGTNLGNAAEKALAGPQRGNVTEYIKGVVLHGNVIDEVDRIARQMGLRFSIQAGEARFLTPTETLSGKAILVTEDTGLVGSPEPGEDGIVSARMLLQPQILPGLRVKIQSAEIDGFFRVERAVYAGDTWGQDWYTDIEAKPL